MEKLSDLLCRPDLVPLVHESVHAVITSYSIHYTKLYDGNRIDRDLRPAQFGHGINARLADPEADRGVSGCHVAHYRDLTYRLFNLSRSKRRKRQRLIHVDVFDHDIMAARSPKSYNFV